MGELTEGSTGHRVEEEEVTVPTGGPFSARDVPTTVPSTQGHLRVSPSGPGSGACREDRVSMCFGGGLCTCHEGIDGEGREWLPVIPLPVGDADDLEKHTGRDLAAARHSQVVSI